MYCEYCGKLGETCCDPQAIFQKTKDDCEWCGKKMWRGDEYFNVRLQHYCKFGNCCEKCDKEKFAHIKSKYIPERWDSLSTPLSVQEDDSPYTEDISN